MIKKSFITGGILFIGYLWFLQNAPAWWPTAQHQWQDNVVKAQRFMYSTELPEKIIVGSSLSNRLVMDSLPGVYNLSFQGQSALDGLSIITSEGKVTKYVFIEINFIDRPENKTFTKTLRHPLFYTIRKELTPLREENQPIGAIGEFMNYLLGKVAPVQPRTAPVAVNGLFEEVLKNQAKSYQFIADKETIVHSISKLRNYVELLRARNVKIVLFEMPVHPTLMQLPRAMLIRQLISDELDSTTYTFVRPPSNHVFKTTDGVHLAGKEAMEYTQYLREQMEIVANFEDLR